GRVKLLPNGPPVSYPVEFRVQGPDKDNVRAIADQVKTVMRAHPKTVGVNDNWANKVKVLRIEVDQIEQDRAAGVDTWTAIVEAAVRRFRPIMLTAAAAVLAMIPLSRSVFWGPMAVAIMGGLIVATVLTLLFLPALYAAWFKVKKAAV
ncbi:MAG: efflux RND transporter permease subunit, partial [Burkholderiales bacterium]